MRAINTSSGIYLALWLRRVSDGRRTLEIVHELRYRRHYRAIGLPNDSALLRRPRQCRRHLTYCAAARSKRVLGSPRPA